MPFVFFFQFSLKLSAAENSQSPSQNIFHVCVTVGNACETVVLMSTDLVHNVRR